MTAFKKELAQGFTLLASSLLGAFSAFALQVLLARQLGVDGYGHFSGLYSAMLIFASLAGAGIGPFLVRGFSRDGLAAKIYLPIAINVLVVSCLIVSVSYAALIYLWKKDFIAAVSLASVIWVFACAEIISAKYQLEGRYFALAGFNALPHVLRVLLVVLVILLLEEAVGLREVSYALLISSVALVISFAVAASGFFLKGEVRLRFQVPVNPNMPPESVSRVLLSSLPFCLSAFLYLAYFQSVIVYSSYFLGDKEAGVMSVCLTLIGAFYILPSIYYQKYLMPKINYWFYHDRSCLVRNYWVGSCGALFLGGGATLFLFLFAEVFVGYIFGAQFRIAGELLGWLAFAVPLRFLGANFGAYLIDEGSQLFKVSALALVALLSLFLFVFGSEDFGLHTGVIALLASEALLMVLFFGFTFFSIKKFKYE